MKKTYSMLLVALSFMPTYAFSLTDKQYEFCKVMALSAEDIMTARQGGISLSRLMEIMNSPEDNKIVSGVIMGWIMEAYKQPLFYTEENKEITIREFSNKGHLECLEYSAYGLNIY